MRRRLVLMVVVGAMIAVLVPVAGSASPHDQVRFATFNASLNRFAAGQLHAELEALAGGASNAQIEAVLDIIALNAPDVLLVNEFDYDDAERSAALFAGLAGYPYWYTAPSNTGVPSGLDLDNSGSVGGPGDAFGFGFFPGQFGMAVFSRFPIDADGVRTFQHFLWADMPGALLPVEPDGTPWYSDEELDAVRLSSKSHWDVPIDIGRKTVHFLVSHPTPPVFDGPEDRNGTRNHDEIRFWADYVHPGRDGYIYDDEGRAGGLQPGSFFVIAGDQNSDPFDGDSIPGSAQQLLEHPMINATMTPESEGAVAAAVRQGGINDSHVGEHRFDTADFADGAPGNLRVDYVLPSKSLRISDSAVFWPVPEDPLFELVGDFPFPASDHRLVWIDVRVPGA